MAEKTGLLECLRFVLSINSLESIGGNSSVGLKKAGGNSTFSANFWGQLWEKLPPVAPAWIAGQRGGLKATPAL
jgi:hypothetical protein